MLIMPASQISRLYGWNSINPADDYWQYLYTDRPRYQTTDTIQYWGMIERRDNNKIKEKTQNTISKFTNKTQIKHKYQKHKPLVFLVCVLCM